MKVNYFTILGYLGSLTPLVVRIETDLDSLHAASTPQARRNAIGDMFGGVVQTASEIVGAKNPAHAGDLAELQKVLQDAVDLWVSQAEQPAPVPVVDPPPAPVAAPTLLPFTWYDNPIPSDLELRQRSGTARGTLWHNAGATQWAITGQAQTMPDGVLPRPY